MRALQIAKAHEEFADDLAAGKAECRAEQFDPLLLGARVMSIEPAGEGAVNLAQFDQAARIGDGGIVLQAVADDAGIGEQALDIASAEIGNARDVPTDEGRSKGGTLLQDGEPGEPRLIDLEHEALEEDAVIARREAIFRRVIGSVEG